MEAPDHPHAHRNRSSTAISVADLLARQAGLAGVAGPASVPDPADPGRAVSVAALLRREGCGPHKVDPPLLPRGHSRPSRKQRPIRKASAVAGVLVAVGAVVGSALIDHAVRERSGPGQPEGVKDATGEELRAFGTASDVPSGGTSVESEPVDAFTLTSVALFIAEALPMSPTGDLENEGRFAEPVLVDGLARLDQAAGTARPRFPTAGLVADGPGHGEDSAGGRAVIVGGPPASSGAARGRSGSVHEEASRGAPVGTPRGAAATRLTGGSGMSAGGPHLFAGHGPDGPGRHGHSGPPGGHRFGASPDRGHGSGPDSADAQPGGSTPLFALALPDAPPPETRDPSAAAARTRTAPPRAATATDAGEVEPPDLRVAAAEARPLHVPERDVARPGAASSDTETTPPDVRIGDTESELPDVEPPSTRVRGTDDDHDDDAGAETSEVNDVVDEVAGTVEDVVRTVIVEDDDPQERSGPEDDGDEAESDDQAESDGEATDNDAGSARSVGEAAARVIDEIIGQG